MPPVFVHLNLNDSKHVASNTMNTVIMHLKEKYISACFCRLPIKALLLPKYSFFIKNIHAILWLTADFPSFLRYISNGASCYNANIWMGRISTTACQMKTSTKFYLSFRFSFSKKKFVFVFISFVRFITIPIISISTVVLQSQIKLYSDLDH